jgi:hypothetical protein
LETEQHTAIQDCAAEWDCEATMLTGRSGGRGERGGEGNDGRGGYGTGYSFFVADHKTNEKFVFVTSTNDPVVLKKIMKFSELEPVYILNSILSGIFRTCFAL